MIFFLENLLDEMVVIDILVKVRMILARTNSQCYLEQCFIHLSIIFRKILGKKPIAKKLDAKFIRVTCMQFTRAYLMLEFHASNYLYLCILAMDTSSLSSFKVLHL